MYISRSTHLLILLLLLTLPAACGKQKNGRQKTDPAPDHEDAASTVKSTTDGSGTPQDQKSDRTLQQQHSNAENEQKATFKVEGMVTQFGMV